MSDLLGRLSEGLRQEIDYRSKTTEDVPTTCLKPGLDDPPKARYGAETSEGDNAEAARQRIRNDAYCRALEDELKR